MSSYNLAMQFWLGLAVICWFVSSTVPQEPCNLYCGGRSSTQSNTLKGQPGSPGKRGPKGTPGEAIQCDCSTSNSALCQKISQVEDTVDTLKDTLNKTQVSSSCKQIKRDFPDSGNGLYTIKDLNGDDYKVYCDMTIDGGGWTLVASVHENNIGTKGSGKCTVGDRWSSEQGNNLQRPGGDGNWENRNIFGRVTAATSDDYKNPAYFELKALNIMIWQVPNDTPLREFNSSSYLKYRTTNGFLAQYGGNLFSLFSDYYPIVSGVYTFPTDSGPAIPVVFDQGDAASLLKHFPINARPGLEAGYIQFRAISTHKDAFALCPGVRNKPTFNYPSQSCLGSAYGTALTYCGDFSGLLHDGHAVGSGWSADNVMLTSTFLIFYR